MMIGGEEVGLWGEGTKSRPNLVKIKTLKMIHVETNLFFMAENCFTFSFVQLHDMVHCMFWRMMLQLVATVKPPTS